MNYKTTSDIKKLTYISAKVQLSICRKGNIPFYKDDRGHYHIDYDSFLVYLEKEDIQIGVFGAIPEGTYTLISGYSQQYAINVESGIVINFDTKKVLKPHPNSVDGKSYYQVKLYKDGHGVMKYIHRLDADVGLIPNKRGCEDIHHIDGDSANNCPDNLLATFKGEEHTALDYARKNKTKKEYKEMVNKIRKLNSEELFKIPHEIFEPDEMFTYYMYVTKKGYDAYRKGEEVPYNTIRRETAERREK